MSARGISRRAAAWVVALLVVFALVMRSIGIGYELPHRPEPDAWIVSQAAWFDRPAGEPETDATWLSNFYPHLFGHLLAALPGQSFARPLPGDAPLAEHLARASEPFLRGRWMVALLSLLLVPATYRLARSFFDRRGALFAAALAATSFLVAFHAQQARPHAAAAPLSAIALVLALRHAQKGGAWSFARASIAAALSVGAFHMGVFVLPSLALAWWFAPGRRAWQLVLPAGSLAASIALFYPFLLERGVTWSDATKSLDLGGQTLSRELITFTGIERIFGGLWSFDPLLCALATAGIAVLGAGFALRRLAFAGSTKPAVERSCAAEVEQAGKRNSAAGTERAVERSSVAGVGHAIERDSVAGERLAVDHTSAAGVERTDDRSSAAGVEPALERGDVAPPGRRDDREADVQGSLAVDRDDVVSHASSAATDARGTQPFVIDARAFAIVALFPLAFLVFWLPQKTVWPRYAIPLVPIAALFAAATYAAASARLPPRALIALAWLAVAFPAWTCARLSWLRANDDTSKLAARWIGEHADPGRDRIGLHVLVALPLPRTQASLAALPTWFYSTWEHYQTRVEGGIAGDAWNLVPLFSPGDLQDGVIERAEIERVLARSPCDFALAPVRSTDAASADATCETLRDEAGAPAWIGATGADAASDAYEHPSLEQILARERIGPRLEWYRFGPSREPATGR